MILSDKKPKSNKERVQEWRDKKRNHYALDKVKQLTGWYEPVEQ